jgi:hypothetical protein
MVTNSTHKADLKSWVEAANEPMCSFSIQNLPYGVFNSNENLETSALCFEALIMR